MNLLQIILTILHMNGFTHVKEQSLIETTCRNTPNYDLCIMTINASPNKATTIEGFGLIMVDAVKTKGEFAFLLIEEIKTQHPEWTARLQECGNTYRAVVNADVPEAVAGLTKGVPKFAESGMLDAKWESDICESSLDGVAWPLRAINKDVHDLALVAIAIIKNLL